MNLIVSKTELQWYGKWCPRLILMELGVVFAVLLVPAIAHAEAWQIRPTVIIEERYDDNLSMQSTSNDEILETLLRGVLAFSRITETTNITGRLHSNFSTHLRNNEISTSNNQYLTFATGYKTELIRWGMDGSYRRDSTIRTVEEIQDIGSAADSDSNDVVDQIEDDIDRGLVHIEVRRNVLQLNPSSKIQLNERSTVGVDYDFLNVFYENNVSGSGLYDYESHGVSGYFRRQLTERDVFSTTLGSSRFTSAENMNTVVDNYNVAFGYQHAYSELSKGLVQVGFRHSQLKSTREKFGDSGFLLQFNLDHKTELTALNTLIEHDLQPSGWGGLVELTQFRIKASRKLRERFSGSLHLRAWERRAIAGVVANTTQYYFEATPQLTWRWTRWWSVAGGYRYRKREVVDSLNDADSNAVFVSVRYSKGIAIN